MQRRKTFKTVGNLPRSGCPSRFGQGQTAKCSTKIPRAASPTVCTSVCMLNVKGHGSIIIRKRLPNYGLFGRVVGRKRLLYKKDMAAQLMFPKLHVEGKKRTLLMEQCPLVIMPCHICSKQSEACQYKCVLTVELCAATGQMCLEVNDSTTNLSILLSI